VTIKHPTEPHGRITCGTNPRLARIAVLDAETRNSLANGQIACPCCKAQCRPTVELASFEKAYGVKWDGNQWIETHFYIEQLLAD